MFKKRRNNPIQALQDEIDKLVKEHTQLSQRRAEIENELSNARGLIHSFLHNIGVHDAADMIWAPPSAPSTKQAEELNAIRQATAGSQPWPPDEDN